MIPKKPHLSLTQALQSESQAWKQSVFITEGKKIHEEADGKSGFRYTPANNQWKNNNLKNASAKLHPGTAPPKPVGMGQQQMFPGSEEFIVQATPPLTPIPCHWSMGVPKMLSGGIRRLQSRGFAGWKQKGWKWPRDLCKGCQKEKKKWDKRKNIS